MKLNSKGKEKSIHQYFFNLFIFCSFDSGGRGLQSGVFRSDANVGLFWACPRGN